MDVNQQVKLEYCLYARKSSESDERQAMSIDSQIKEIMALAERDGIYVKEVRQESHSAKESGTRPVFMQMIQDLRSGKFNGILTWSPDRCSRNAGDLGSLVDLMDQGKLLQIRTYGQVFSNTPNDKFLLMILCSQAKLENDNKGINVKRGIRTKCEMGWRPGMPPIGYYNRSFAGVKDIVVDPDRGHIVTEMFKRVAEEGQSGRTLKKWLDTCLTTRAGKKVTLSQIYLMLKNPFYYGEFEYPTGKGIWYKGSHQPLVSKDIFDQVQKQLIAPKKAKWGSKSFIFKDLFKCASCGSLVIGEDRYRKRKHKQPRYHIYYHCTRQKKYGCPEPYLTEDKLVKQILRYLNFMYMAHPNLFTIKAFIKESMDAYKKMRDEILWAQDINPENKPVHFMDYANYIFRNGTIPEKRAVTNILDRQLYIHNETVTSVPLI